MHKYSKIFITGSGVSFIAAIVASFIAIYLIKIQAFSSIFALSFSVQSSELAGAISEIGPAAVSSSVEIMAEDNQLLARLITGLSLGLSYSPVIAGFVLQGIILWRIHSQRNAEKTIPIGVFIFGFWIIASTVLAQLLSVFASKLFISYQDIPTTPGDKMVWVEAPTMYLSQEIIVSITVGIVLMSGAILVNRGLHAEKELGEVI